MSGERVLVAGGTGRLGRLVVERLRACGLVVRVLTREAARATALGDVEVAVGDWQDAASLSRACVDVQTVVSAWHGYNGPRDASPERVDVRGNRALFAAARAAAARHGVLLSVVGAAPDSPMELFRAKYQAEQELRASGLEWTMVRATAFMELWAELIGTPLLRSGKTRLFGRGEQPLNFVSVHDVAAVVERAVCDAGLRGQVIDVVGPADLSLRQMAEAFQRVAGGQGTITPMKLPVMRVLGTALRPVNPTLARHIRAAVVLDTQGLPATPSTLVDRPRITLDEVIRRDHVGTRVGDEVPAVSG